MFTGISDKLTSMCWALAADAAVAAGPLSLSCTLVLMAPCMCVVSRRLCRCQLRGQQVSWWTTSAAAHSRWAPGTILSNTADTSTAWWSCTPEVLLAYEGSWCECCCVEIGVAAGAPYMRLTVQAELIDRQARLFCDCYYVFRVLLPHCHQCCQVPQWRQSRPATSLYQVMGCQSSASECLAAMLRRVWKYAV